MRRQTLSLVTLVFVAITTCAQQPDSPEQLAFNAVSAATNPASRVAAAEDFVANFPKSLRRPDVANLVSQQLLVVRNPSIAVTLLDRARSIFTEENEWAQLKTVALDVYLNANRLDQAFEVGADILSHKPYEFAVLVKLATLGANASRSKNLTYADTSLRYGLRATQIIEQNERPSGVLDEEWASQKEQLPLLYQHLAIIRLAEGNSREAKEHLNKAITLDPLEPSNFALLGRILNGDYEQRTSLLNDMPEGNTKLKRRNDWTPYSTRLLMLTHALPASEPDRSRTR
jgi:tetratricopeptide (TPR) repeat protein